MTGTSQEAPHQPQPVCELCGGILPKVCQRLLTADQLFTLLSQLLPAAPKRNTLTKWRYTGEGPPYLKVSNRTYYPAAEAHAWAIARFSAVVRSGRELSSHSKREAT